MKTVCVVFLFCLVSQLAAAQSIPIHGSSQKAAYNSPAEWPFISLQQHWSRANDMTPGDPASLLNPSIGHVHVECNVPIWGELTFEIVLPCDIKLFHVAGAITFLFAGSGGPIPDPTIIWDATGTSELPDGGYLVGDPMGLKTWTFKRTVDPTLWRDVLPHGWVQLQFYYRLYTNNGAILNGLDTIPFYSAWDTNQPESNSNCDGCGARLRSSLNPMGVPGDGEWGAGIVEVMDVLPILGPLTSPVQFDSTSFKAFRGYNYGNTVLVGENIGRVDIDLHNGSEGRPITFGRFDPAEIGAAGPHKVAMMWKQDTEGGDAIFSADEGLVALIVVTVNVSDTIPPPVDCVVGPWENLSSAMSLSPAVTAGNLQTRTITTTVQQQRTILTQPANGGTACPVN